MKTTSPCRRRRLSGVSKVKSAHKSQEKPCTNETFEPYDILLILTEKSLFTVINKSVLSLSVGTSSDISTKHIFVDSKYTLYDLVKITSRKNSGCTITFYFRVPPLDEYDESSQDGFFSKVDQKPSSA